MTSNPCPQVNLYVRSSRAGSSLQSFQVRPFNHKVFVAGGAISIGKFQISQKEKKWKKTDNFVGCYDNIGFASK